MDFALSEEHQALQKMCRDFAAREIAPHAAGWSERAEFPAEAYRKMGDLGLMGMLVEERYGGAESGMVAYVAAMEEIGNADQSVAAGWNAHSTIATLPLATFGTEEQKERWLRPLAEGKKIGAFALTEPTAGSDAAGIRTQARQVDGGWVLNGTKMFISNAGTPISLGASILARTGSDGNSKRFGVFFVPEGTEGYTKGKRLKKLGWHALDTRELVFTDCFVPDDHLIGNEHDGLRQFLDVLDLGRISVAALSLSLARAALEMAIEQAEQREQFGKPLRSFQAIGHKLADMATEVEAARWLVYRAAWLADTKQPYRQAAAMAKLYASEAANRGVSDSLQIHGGYGYMLESRISRFFADAKVLEIGEGTSEIQRNVIAQSLVTANQ
jgi:alkylation response protein AidB-like acyl-CoA dehydrogenase